MCKTHKKIWWKEGSPLIVLSRRLFDKVKNILNFPVSLAMRYGSISINKGLKELQDIGVNEVIVLPLYPHYAMSSYETVVEKVKDGVNKAAEKIADKIADKIEEIQDQH